MKFLFDFQHPAHLHFFRNVIIRLLEEGHQVRATARDKDIVIELSHNYPVDIEIFGVARQGVFNLGRELLYRQVRLFKIIREFKPDVIMAIAGTFVSILGKITKTPVYVFYDTEHATISNLLAYPFSTCIYVPQCYRKKISWRHVRYNGYHELAYLHPNYFSPDHSVLSEMGLEKGEKFSILRFVAWGAAHDIGLEGFSLENKFCAVKALEKFGRVIISCEGDLPPDLEKYRVRLSVAKMHDLMAFASLIFGESATMCSEGAVLGVPGVYVDPVGRGYTDEQEKLYGLVYNFTSEYQEAAISKGIEILSETSREEWVIKKERLLQEKIDVTYLIYKIAKERPYA